MVGQLLQSNIVTINATDPDSINVNTNLVFEQLRALKSTYTFYELLSWTAATGVLKKAGTSGSNSRYGFFSIPQGTKVSRIEILLNDDGQRGSTADEVNYGIGCLAPIPVDIDIKPQSYPNCFNVNGHGVIPVAILGSADFDVTQIDCSTLSFAGLAVRVRGKKGAMCHVSDVSGDFTSPEGAPDGYPDLVCQFEDDPSAWEPGSSDAELTGNLLDGTRFIGSDEICVTQEIPETQ
jgi:hypothetical protein